MAEPVDPYVNFDPYHVLSLDWWLHHLASAYRDNPIHMLTELALIVLILWLVFKRDRRKQPSEFDRLSVREQEELIREWKPEPLVPPHISKQYGIQSKAYKEKTRKDSYSSSKSDTDGYIHVNSGVGSTVTDGDKEYIHLSSQNYLGMATNPEVLSAAEKTIKKYAVGSCGPRGFYGTMDIHLNLERALSEYFGNPAIIYADYVGCPASVITAFAKRGDLLLIDEGCHYLITQGAILSRSNVIWFEHNNMKALEVCLQTVQEEDTKSNRPLNRRFIVTEGVFHNYGDICKLNKIVELKQQYKYRLILDDSHGLGTLHPRGTPGFYNIDTTKIDMYFAGMDKSLGSTGGFCVGNKEITHHQTLSGAGYVFSASAPPFSCSAAQTALKLMDENGEEYCQLIKNNASLMRELLKDDDQSKSEYGPRWNTGFNNKVSPLIHLRFNDKLINDDIAEQYFDVISNECRKKGILVYASIYLPQEFGIPDKCDPKPSLRICLTKDHTKEQINKAAQIIKELLKDALENKTGFLSVNNDTNVEDEKQEED